MSDAPHLLTQDQDGILIVTLNRPDKLNALSAQTMALFEQALLRFRDTPELRVMLIRATGRYFCSGADLKSGTNPDYPRTFILAKLTRMITELIENLPIRIVRPSR